MWLVAKDRSSQSTRSSSVAAAEKEEEPWKCIIVRILLNSRVLMEQWSSGKKKNGTDGTESSALQEPTLVHDSEVR